MAVALFIATPFLMGKGCGENKEEVCDTALALAQSYRVTGNCGSSGTILISGPAQNCSLTLTGDAVGLPDTGSRINAPGTDLAKGGWTLGGVVNGVIMRCRAAVEGSAIQMTCDTDATLGVCTAILTPAP